MSVARVKTKRTINTYVVLWTAAWNALDQATGSLEGSYWNSMSASLYRAFTLEAYFNHIGCAQFADWETIERKLRPEDKLKKLNKKLGFAPDFSKRPWQSFTPLFKFRNDLAHGKSVTLQTDKRERVPKQGHPTLPLARWEKLCSTKEAQEAFDDTRQMIEQLHKRAGFPDDPLGDFGLTTWEIYPNRIRPRTLGAVRQRGWPCHWRIMHSLRRRFMAMLGLVPVPVFPIRLDLHLPSAYPWKRSQPMTYSADAATYLRVTRLCFHMGMVSS